jgi:hypothetical protein
LDLERRFGDRARLAGHPRCSSFDRACSLVAFFGRDAVDTQRHRILRVDIRHRSVASFGPRNLGRVPGRTLDRPPICVSELSGRRKLDPLQRLAAAQLFHHGVYCCAGLDPDRSHAKPGDLEQARLAWDSAEPAGGPFHPLHLGFAGSCCSFWRTASWCSLPVCGRTPITCSRGWRATRGLVFRFSSWPWCL